VVVELSQSVDFHLIPSETALVVQFRGLLRDGRDSVLDIQDNLVRQARLSRSEIGLIRLTLDLKEPGARHAVFVLPRVDGRPHRLVIDVENPFAARAAEGQGPRPQAAVRPDKGSSRRVVVIDPGHGGEDPGALGPRNTREKDVVLAIAKALQRRLDKPPAMRAMLTRSGDYFLSLRQRVEIAKDQRADLFMSIHADASPNRSTRGASVYCLSLSGATDEAARILAEKENAADLVGGVRLNGDASLNTILLDLVQTQTVNDSLRFGGVVLEAMAGVQGIKFPTPRQAGFRVLKAPDIPSLLVEVGFLSNAEEERLLDSPAFQERLAAALEQAVHQFLGRWAPSPAPLAASEKAGGAAAKPKTHVVKRGESLSDIAGLYRTSVRELTRANDIKDGSRIYAGQRILIP
jgi:N-acetylmuramoyl-L-alanine amidase